MRRSPALVLFLASSLVVAAGCRDDGGSDAARVPADTPTGPVGLSDTGQLRTADGEVAPPGDTALATDTVPALAEATPQVAVAPDRTAEPVSVPPPPTARMPQPPPARTALPAPEPARTPAPRPDSVRPAQQPASRSQAPAVLRESTPPARTEPPAAPAESPRRVAEPAQEPAAARERPFFVGERLTYEVRFGPISVGTATMHVVSMERVRDITAYRTRFEVRGGNRLYRVNDSYESWFDARTMASLRYMQDINEGSYKRQRTFEIFPDRRVYLESGNPEEQPSVEFPLDEGSFLYFMRTIPLEVGRVYDFDRYFRPDRNPVRVHVLRKEQVRVPAGTFDAIVVRPTIKTSGIFSEGGRAEVWFADDSTRRVLQIRSRLSFGSLNLYLKSIAP